MPDTYTPGAYRVGPCTKCSEPIALQMPDKPGVDIDEILSPPRECPGFHYEHGPWRDFATREEIARGHKRLRATGEVVDAPPETCASYDGDGAVVAAR